MLQFVTGFLLGCMVTSLIIGCFYRYQKKHNEDNNATGESLSTEKEMVAFKDTVSILAPKVKILLVDDSKLSRTFIKGFLAQTQIEIVEAEDGFACLELVKGNRFDLIFLDHMMPGMDGIETFQRMKMSFVGEGQVPVVALSSSIRKENEEEYEKLGFAGYLGKPIQGTRLERLLLRLLPADKVTCMPEGFSYENGLKNFDGNNEMYRETLVLFAQLWEDRKEQLREFLEEKNMPEYAILIHAIKGDARTLGADAFGKLAYDQELKAKDGNVKGIQSGFQNIIEVGDKTAKYFMQKYS